jgi:hypothetical protein
VQQAAQLRTGASDPRDRGPTPTGCGSPVASGVAGVLKPTLGAAKERPQNEGIVRVNTRTIAIIALIIAVIVLLLLIL